MTTTLPLRKAVIPVAGIGTRLFPATRIMKKELFPVVGPNGVARPALLWIMHEALSAGIEEIILVVRPDDLDDFKRLFNEPLPQDHYERLPSRLQQEADQLLVIGQQIQFAIQPLQEGYGHAVWCAKPLIGDEPMLLMLGDHLYRSHTQESCAAQLSGIYSRNGGNVIGLAAVDEDELAHRGVIGSIWRPQEGLLAISEFAEKPTIEYAREHLRIPGLGQYLVAFGQYILQPIIFEYLDQLLRDNIRERGEYQFTTAIEMLRRDHACLGYMIKGDSYDIGQPRFYVEGLQAFARPV